jgi:hypothetical protein
MKNRYISSSPDLDSPWILAKTTLAENNLSNNITRVRVGAFLAQEDQDDA